MFLEKNYTPFVNKSPFLSVLLGIAFTVIWSQEDKFQNKYYVRSINC